MQESAQTNPCPQCSHQNTADSKYCANCNLHINGVCPRCATHNLHSTHFCSSCGLDFAPATSHGLARSTGLPVDMPVRTRTKPGGVIRRAVAYTLDMLIAPAAAILPYFVIPDVRYYEVNITSSWNVFWAFAFFYPPVALTLWSTTFWKRLFNLYVVNLDGTPIGFLQALNREIWKFSTAIPLGLTFWVAVFRKDKRALHDLIAGTVVVQQ